MPLATLRALVVLAAFLLTTGAPAHADELQDVSALVKAGRLDEAGQRADRFLAKTPKDAQMRFLKGVILSQRERRDEAIAIFTGLNQDYPELPEPYNNLAVLYAAKGAYEQARAALETATRVSPDYATAYENLGDVYAALAARSYADARRHDASNGRATRKMESARALLAGAAAPAAASTVVASAVPVDVATRSQRNVGLPQPAGPPAVTLGVGASAPDIVVPANATSVPSGSNVVGVDRPASDSAAIDAVTAEVERWARSRSLSTAGLAIRVDGDVAVARFRGRALTLKRNGGSWTVTGEEAS